MSATLAEVVDIIPALKDKCAVSLISRLGAAREQIRVQQENEGFFNELIGFFTGKTVRRQNQVNAHLAATLEMTVEWLTEVTESVALGNQAIIEVRLGLEKLQSHTTFLACEVYDLRMKLEGLAGLVDQRFYEIDNRLTELDVRLRACRQLDRVMNKWSAGLLNELPPAQRCYVVMEELWWGDFGHL